MYTRSCTPKIQYDYRVTRQLFNEFNIQHTCSKAALDFKSWRNQRGKMKAVWSPTAGPCGSP